MLAFYLMAGDFTRFEIKQTETQGTSVTSSGVIGVNQQRTNLEDRGSKDKDRFSQAFNVGLNYWELKPAQYDAHLQDLMLRGIRTVSAFVPWAHTETDIYHSLKKFVRAAHGTKLRLRLFVMPELGVNYPNAGFPKDLLSSHANLAVDRLGQVIYNLAAPNIFPLPSFSSPEVLKRFGNFLIKVGSVLAEVFAEVRSSEFCEIVVTNSLFNYYRSHGLKLSDHGDYSAAHVMAFRDFLDREYTVAKGAPNEDTEQFKMQIYETYNRHKYFTHVEKLLREKTDLVFSRKGCHCAVRHVDLFNPECGAETAYENLFIELYDYKPSLRRYYESIISGGYRGESIYLGNTGVFRRFADQEKSFLLLASMVHAGEVNMMSEELFKLSNNFQRKLRGLLDFLGDGAFVRHRRVTYFTGSKFSMEDRSFKLLSSMAPGVTSVVAGVSANNRELSERLAFLDPKMVMRSLELLQSLAIAQTGKVVAIPAPLNTGSARQSGVANYTMDAQLLLEKFKKGKTPLRINIGLPYEVYEYHLGHVVIYDPRSFWQMANSVEPGKISASDDMVLFFKALIGLADVRSVCNVSDPRIHMTSYVSQEDQNKRLLFLINPTNEEISLTLEFTDVVAMAPLPAVGTESSNPLSDAILGSRFELSVPALGVLSVRVTEPSSSEIAEWS